MYRPPKLVLLIEKKAPAKGMAGAKDALVDPDRTFCER